MQLSNRWAFKEWAVICAALAKGRQVVILRKGGIHEGRAGFRVHHGEFWLLPTYLHQSIAGVVEKAEPLLYEVLTAPPPAGIVRISQYAVVEQVFEVDEPSRLATLAGQHIWSLQTLEQRFHYGRPGLLALAVRVYQIPNLHEMRETRHIAGCRSWVDLQQELPTAGAQPVVSDAEFAERLTRLQWALGL
jgi:hypothetical protein